MLCQARQIHGREDFRIHSNAQQVSFPWALTLQQPGDLHRSPVFSGKWETQHYNYKSSFAVFKERKAPRSTLFFPFRICGSMRWACDVFCRPELDRNWELLSGEPRPPVWPSWHPPDFSLLIGSCAAGSFSHDSLSLLLCVLISSEMSESHSQPLQASRGARV